MVRLLSTRRNVKFGEIFAFSRTEAHYSLEMYDR